MAKRRRVPKILPREPMTAKALAAITEYAFAKGKRHHNLGYFLIKFVLEAERMRRADLYAWLERKGYRWLPKVQIWRRPGERVAQ